MSKSLRVLNVEGITYDKNLGLYILKNGRVINLINNPIGMFVDFTRDNELALKENGNSYILGGLVISNNSVYFNRMATNSFIQVRIKDTSGLVLPERFREITYKELVTNNEYLDQVITDVVEFFRKLGVLVAVVKGPVTGRSQVNFDLYQVVPGMSNAIHLLTPSYGMTTLALKESSDRGRPVLSLASSYPIIEVGQVSVNH